jgi:hypothetical protein
MMAITTNSSTRVKPRAFDLVTMRHLLGVRKPMKKMMNASSGQAQKGLL